MATPIIALLWKVKNRGEDNHNCLQKLEIKLDEHLKDSEKDRQQMDKIKDEGKLALERAKQDANNDRNELRIRIEKLTSKIDTLTEKVTESEKIHNEFRQMFKDQQQFFVDWIQRLEDVTRDNQFYQDRRRRKRVTTDTDEPMDG